MTDYRLYAPATRRLRSAVDADLRNMASAHEVLTLKRRENLVTWLRVLAEIQSEVEEHIAKSRTSIAHLRPISGTAPSNEWLKAKRAVDARTTARLHFLGKVREKQAEVRALIGAEGLTPHTLGTVIDALVRAETLLAEGDPQGAHEYITALIDRYERDES